MSAEDLIEQAPFLVICIIDFRDPQKEYLLTLIRHGMIGSTSTIQQKIVRVCEWRKRLRMHVP